MRKNILLPLQSDCAGGEMVDALVSGASGVKPV